MHGQGNYVNQTVQGTYAPPPLFQQNPAAASVPPPPPPFHHGPLPPQWQVIQQGHGSFQLPPGGASYPHALPSGTPQHGPPPPSGMISGKSYSTRLPPPPPPPQVYESTQISHSYPTSEQQFSPWSQSVPQFPPKAPHPVLGTYPLHASQGYTIQRETAHQTPSQNAPPPRPPPYPSSSSFSSHDPYGSSILVPHHSFPQSLGPLPPPPPPPLPPRPPTHSPPGVPPLLPSSPPLHELSKNDGSHNLIEDSSDRGILVLDHPSPMMLMGNSLAHERNEKEVKATDAVLTHSPADSDMDMEDDITQPDEEKTNGLLNNTNDPCESMPDETDEKQFWASHNLGGNKILKVAVDREIISAGPSISKDKKLGTESPPGCDISVTSKVFSEADRLGMKMNGETEHSMDVIDKKSVSQHDQFSHPSVPVAPAEIGLEKLSSELRGSANAFKLLEGYASDSSTEIEGENLHDVSPPTLKIESTNRDVRYGSEPRLQSLSDSTKFMHSCTMTKSPRNVMGADKTSFATGQEDVLADNSHANKKSVALEGGKSKSAKLNVDEFGRLVREGVSDSDDGGSLHHTRKPIRRDQERSRSRSSSYSSHDRNRRSPWRRRKRRGRSRSFSPRRRRSRSRSPVLRRGKELVGDKNRWNKSQPAECFDFYRGKCYRGATCRYSHHESYKSERLRHGRGKQPHEDEENKVHPLKASVHENIGKEDEGLKFLQDMPSLKEVKVPEELPADPTVLSHDKSNYVETASFHVDRVIPSNLSGYSSHDVHAGNKSSSIKKYPAQYPDKVPQIHQECKVVDDSLVPESSSPIRASPAQFTAFKPDTEQNLTSQTSLVGRPMIKPVTLEEVPPKLNLPLPSVSRVMDVPVAQLISRDYNFIPPPAPFHQKPETYQPYQVPMSHQNSHFLLPSNCSSNSFLLPPPPPPPPLRSHLTANVTTGEHSIPSLHMHHSLLSYTSSRPYPTEFPSVQGPGQIQHNTDDFRSSFPVSNILGQQGVPHNSGEDCSTGHPVQCMNPSHPIAQSESTSLHGSMGVNRLSNINSCHSLPYFQPTSYGLQYPAANGTSSQLGEPGKVSSSVSRITGGFLEMNPQSRPHDFVGSRISNHFNPHASTFDQPLSTKFSSNPRAQGNDKPFNAMYGASGGLSSVYVDAHKIGSVSSKNMAPSSCSARGAEGLITKDGQYDPLFDSIDLPSNSFTRVGLQNNETIGDSDNFQKSSESSKVLHRENIKQEAYTAVSSNDSLDFEEFGETADVEVGDVVNGSPTTPNDAIATHEIDQVKASGKMKKGKDSRSTKHFKNSIATFVKEVLKPSWRQGNMSKEAFKTIVKKTVDKVSGAMKSHKIPRSQEKINHYIDSSRGKLTKLVMGYVDKYVNM